MKSNQSQPPITVRQKAPVHLREKKLRNGNISLYLDKYYNGERQYEFLNLYLITPLTPTDRAINQRTLTLAQNIMAERILEIQREANGVPTYKLDHSFIDHLKLMMRDRYNSKGNYENWDSAVQHVELFTGGKDVTFRQVDSIWLTRFKGYLQNCLALKGTKKLAQNSQYSYYNKIKAALRKAFEDGYIAINPAATVRGIPQGETNRENLTLEEVQKLAHTPCTDPNLKKAFLFAVFTGLRWGDVTTITWRQIEHSHSIGHFIRFNQKKTKGREFLPISQQARDILGQSGEASDPIFNGLYYSTNISLILSKWMVKAGINKHITFHCARHTHATLLLASGVDIYVLSKMLGHKNISTTEIYTKVLSPKKIEAASKIPTLDLSAVFSGSAALVEKQGEV